MSGPLLQGVRVIDVTAYASGPMATMMLAEQGADVVKIEPPGHGDLMRTIGAHRHGISSIFAALNRNKRSVAIDLTQPRGQELARSLVATADVFVHNYRPGTPARLGLDEASIRPLAPDLVYAAISGFGLRGPRRDQRAYDSVVQAVSGVAAHQADPATGVPAFVRNAMLDKTTGLVTAQLVTAALFARERGGGGRRVDVSMLHTALWFMWSDGMQDVAWIEPDEAGSARATQPPVRRTLDGFLAISTNQDVEFRSLCEVLDVGELADDPRFATAGERSRNGAALWAIVEPVLERWVTADLAARLVEVDVPHAVVTPLDRIHEDPQVVADDLLVEIEQPPGGPIRSVRPIGRVDGDAAATQAPAPRLGQHTDEVLGEVGIDAYELTGLREAGVIA